jgi:uncharacterized protein YcbK (DUF882 family)
MDPRRRAFVLGGGALFGSAALGGAVGLASRRPVVTAAPAPRLATAASSLPAPAIHTKVAADTRRLFLHNLHTGDTIKTVYWADGRYVDGALAEARHALRDWRNGAQHDMDPRLFDVLHDLGARLEVDRPFQIISGYRSPESNAAMHAASSGVAKNSLHMQGMASDIRVEGVELAHIRKAALSLGRGGVGFYPVSDFVHVDTGRVRQWTGA